MRQEIITGHKPNLPERIGRFFCNVVADFRGEENYVNENSPHINRRIGTIAVAGIAAFGSFLGWAYHDMNDRMNSYQQLQDKKASELEKCIDDIPNTLPEDSAIQMIRHCETTASAE